LVYNLQITDAAKHQLAKIDKQTARRINKKLQEVAQDPFQYVTKLVGLELYKLRVGDYRILLDIQKKTLVIIIIEVSHRRNVYK